MVAKVSGHFSLSFSKCGVKFSEVAGRSRLARVWTVGFEGRARRVERMLEPCSELSRSATYIPKSK